MSEAEDGWLQRDREPATDDAGAVLLAWRVGTGRTQTDVAGVLGTTQQHLSQLETGQRPISLELRRKIVTELGIAAEDLGLACGHARKLVSRDDASPEIAASRLRWRDERRWLNQHSANVAKLAGQLYPAEYRLPDTGLLAPPEWRLVLQGHPSACLGRVSTGTGRGCEILQECPCSLRISQWSMMTRCLSRT